MKSKILCFLFQIVIRTSTSDMVYKGKESNGIPVQIGESRRPKTKTKGQMCFQKEDRDSSQESRQGSLQILTSSALSNPTPTSSLTLWQITCYSLPYLQWSTLHPLSSLPSSLLCPAGTAQEPTGLSSPGSIQVNYRHSPRPQLLQDQRPSLIPSSVGDHPLQPPSLTQLPSPVDHTDPLLQTPFP